MRCLTESDDAVGSPCWPMMASLRDVHTESRWASIMLRAQTPENSVDNTAIMNAMAAVVWRMFICDET